jgi:peptidoglycan/LPS O-acetylase OafA/YrhL
MRPIQAPARSGSTRQQCRDATASHRRLVTAATAARPAPSTRLPYLDGYRGAAACAVLVYHVASWSGWTAGNARFGLDVGAWMTRLGNYGVCVFFLLSGLVLYRPFAAAALGARAAPATAPYYARRVLRIYPAYIVALTAWYALGAFPLAGTLRPAEYVWQYLLVQNHVARGLETSLPNAWTLSIEVSFYFALPLLAALIRRLPGGRSSRPGDRMVAQLTGLTVLLIVAFGFRWVLLGSHIPAGPGQPTLWLPNHLDWFALGMLLAVVHAWRAEGGVVPRWLTGLGERPLVCWTGALGLFWLLVSLRLPIGAGEDYAAATLRFSLSGVSAFLALLPAVLLTTPHRAMRALGHPAIVWLGVISYGIYLWHLIVLQAAAEMGLVLSFAPLLALTISVTLVLAFVSHWALERPVLAAARSAAATPIGRARDADGVIAVAAHLPATATGRL